MLRLAAIVPLLVASGALAVEPAAPVADATHELVSLHYAGAAGCPAEAQFVEEVTARVRRSVRFGAQNATIKMVVTLARSGEQALGRLEIERPASEPTRREFNAATCEEVGSALALVAALALDPNARTEPLSPRAASTEPPSVAPVAEPAAANPAPPPVRPSPPPAATPSRYAAWIGPSAGVVAGESPGVLGLFGLSLGVRAITGRTFSPALQLTPLWGKTGVTGPDTNKGEFAWAMGRLEGCPVSFSLAEQVRLDPCVAVEAGRLTVRGADEQIDVPVSVERWWVAPGTTLALHLVFRGFFARLGGSALFPVTRDEFVFHEPNRKVHQASPLVVGASLGLGFQLGE